MTEKRFEGINSQYRCKESEKIGSGAQGSVYKVQCMQTEKHYALKAFQLAFDPNEEDKIKLAKREIDLLTQLNNPGIPKVIDKAKKEGEYFYVMDFIEGESLRKKLEKKIPFTQTEVLNYVKDLTTILDTLHTQGIAHRDIKPENIIITKENEVTLVDFGISKNVVESTITQTNRGTKIYQPQGHSPQTQKDFFQDDIYSLGVTMYELFHGKPPWNPKDSIFPEVTEEQFKTDISPKGKQICLHMLKINRHERYNNTQEILKDINTQSAFTPSIIHDHVLPNNRILQYTLLALSIALIPLTYTTLFNSPSKHNQEITQEQLELLQFQKAEELYKDGNDCYKTLDYNKAKKYYEQAAKHNHVEAMAQLATLYQRGHGVKRNYQKAVDWWKQAEKLGHKTANENIGFLYRNGGEGLDKNYENSLKYYKKAFYNDNKHYVAIDIGEIYEDTTYELRESEPLIRAEKWYELADKKGFGAKANEKLGILTQREDYPSRSYKKSKVYYIKAFEAGNNKVLIKIANLYMEGGYGLEQDYMEAEKWYIKAAEKENIEAIKTLAHMYHQGERIEKNYTKALKWYQKILQSTLITPEEKIKTETIIGNIYFKGDKKLKSNWEKAGEYYLKVVDQEDPKIMLKLATIYSLSEDSTLQDQSVLWYKKGLELYLNNTESELDINELEQIGDNYLYGLNEFEKDHVQALQLYKQATLKGNTNTAKKLADIYYYQEENFKQAFEWYLKALENGDNTVLKTLGIMCRLAHGTKKNDIKALDFFKKAFENGDHSAAYLVGEIYESLENSVNALLWYNKGLDQNKQINDINFFGTKGIAYHLQEHYIQSSKWYNMTESPEKAFEFYDSISSNTNNIKNKEGLLQLYEKIAQQKHEMIFLYVGYLYMQGINNFPIHYKKALEWCTRGLEVNGVHQIKFVLGIERILNELNSRPPKQDYLESLEWNTKINFPLSYFIEEFTYNNIKNTVKYPDSLKIYKQLANKGYHRALGEVGCLYMRGDFGFEKNKKKASKYFYQALEKGSFFF